MHNKYVYAFSKDTQLRLIAVTALIGIVGSVLLFKTDVIQSIVLKDRKQKQALINQIPMLRMKIEQYYNNHEYVLQGIVSNKAEPMAVVNNVLLKVGEEVRGKKLMAIMNHAVKICDAVNTEQCMQLMLEQ